MELLSLKSPCVNVCSINKKTNLCDGCFRTLNEVSYWNFYDDKQKQIICNQLQIRRNNLLYGGYDEEEQKWDGGRENFI